ncbi:MAG: response regulator [Chloroflexi bacterium]|nr:response regulator [Chloroflexota bacterium]
MANNIRVLLVDDHQVVRDGLCTMLRQEPDIEIIGQSAGGEDALTQVAVLTPDIVVTDIKMPRIDGIQLAFLIKERLPACSIIMLTLYDEYLSEAMQVGARGYLLKDITSEELAQAIRRVYRGEVVVSGNINPVSDAKEANKAAPKTAAVPVNRPDSPESMLEEIQLVMPPPVDPNQLIRFTKQVDKTLHPRIVQVVGSWREGTTVTAVLPWATPLADALASLRDCPEVDSISEEPPKWEASRELLQKASALSGQRAKPRKTIFVRLKNCKATPEPGPSFLAKMP